MIYLFILLCIIITFQFVINYKLKRRKPAMFCFNCNITYYTNQDKTSRKVNVNFDVLSICGDRFEKEYLIRLSNNHRMYNRGLLNSLKRKYNNKIVSEHWISTREEIQYRSAPQNVIRESKIDQFLC